MTSTTERAFYITNLGSDSPQIRLAHNPSNLQSDVSKADGSIGFVMEGSRITKFLSRSSDGSVKEQTVTG